MIITQGLLGTAKINIKINWLIIETSETTIIMESTSILLSSLNWLYSNCMILTITLVVYVLVKQLWWEYNLRKNLGVL